MRKVYLDNLRYAVVISVILYHIVYMFNSVGIITNVDIAGVKEMDIVIYILYPWFMAILFVISGMCARYALQMPQMTGKKYWKKQMGHLLLPSVAGVFVLGWISGAATNFYSDMFMGNGTEIPVVAKYLIYCLCGIGPLWYMHELLLAILVLLLIRKIDKKEKLVALGQKVNLPILCILVLFVWGSAQILNTPLIEVYRNGIYIFMFLLGYYVFSHENVMETVEKNKWIFGIIAFISGIAYCLYFWGQNPCDSANLRRPLTNIYAWFMVLFLLGVAKSYWTKENRFTLYMRKNGFAFYVLHYHVLTVIAFVLDQYLHISGIALYPLMLVGEAVLLPIVSWIVKKIPIVRTLVLGRQ